VAKNIFVVGMDDFNHRQLTDLRHAQDYIFHSLGSHQEIKSQERFDIAGYLERAAAVLAMFDGRVDAIVGFWDFPVSTMLPILRRQAGLPGPTLEAVLKCEHKYWSRIVQQAVVPETVPSFCAVDPFAEDAVARCPLDYPFWLKPVKSASSHLGFRVHNEKEFRRSLAAIRAGIDHFAVPFNHILDMAELPPEIALVDGRHCIAESIISSGRQCTLEGYVLDGEVQIYGVVDSVREGRHRSSFARYQYPSILPRPVQQRMVDAATRVLRHIGYDHSPFNAEFYWDSRHRRIRLLEINTRISKSHTPLFKLVDGEYNHAVMIDVALGQRPDFPRRAGRYRVAAKFMLRRTRDGVARSVPGLQQIEAVRRRFPGTEIQLAVNPGMRLSELREQDSYSYEVAVIFMGAASQTELLANYRQVVEMLAFEFVDAEAA
jgi:biotin carboxylase